jgi:uncharacterized protein YkwD
MVRSSTCIRRSLGVLTALAASLATPAGRAEDAGARFSPGAAAAEQFGPNPAIACPRSVAADVLAFELKKLSDKNKRPEAQLDGRLCAVAQSLLAWDPAKGDSPPAAVRAFLSSHFGLPVPARVATVRVVELGETGDERKSATTEEAKALAEKLKTPVGETLLGYQQPRWGMATQRVKKGQVKVAVVMDDRILELDPLPRKLSADQTAPLSGKVLPPYRNPKLALSGERGQITRPEPAGGDAFRGELRCGSTPGDLWVEIRADRDGQAATVAAFSVACGKDLPTSVALSGGGWPADEAGQERRLADGVNGQREAIGLPRMEWDDRLAGVARTVAETVRDQVKRGESPAVDLGPLLEKAGVASPLVLQNPAQAWSAEEAEQRFTASPSNRQNLLNPEVNRVGVGIAPTQDAAGKPSMFVVELFTKTLAQIDRQSVQRDLYAAVEKRRSEAGAKPAKVDPRLEKVAQQYADALAEAGGKLSQDDASELTQGIRIAYKSIDMIDGVKANPIDFAADQTALSPGSSIGIGVAQGDSPVLGKNAVFVTLIVATPRVEGGKPAAAPKPKPAKKP